MASGCWRVNNPTLWDFCVSMIGRADIEGSKSNVAMSAWLPPSWTFLRPQGSIGHVFKVCIRTADMSAVSHSRHVCCAKQQTCLLSHTAGTSAVLHTRHGCCVTEQTCLLWHTVDLSAVSCSQHFLLCHNAKMFAVPHSRYVCCGAWAYIFKVCSIIVRRWGLVCNKRETALHIS